MYVSCLRVSRLCVQEFAEPQRQPDSHDLKVAMAYALGFPPEVTLRIESLRDWRLEEVKRNGGTPSRLALIPFDITTRHNSYSQWYDKYMIKVEKNTWTDNNYVMARVDGKFERLGEWMWGESIDNGNGYRFSFDDVGSLLRQVCE